MATNNSGHMNVGYYQITSPEVDSDISLVTKDPSPFFPNIMSNKNIHVFVLRNDINIFFTHSFT